MGEGCIVGLASRDQYAAVLITPCAHRSKWPENVLTDRLPIGIDDAHFPEGERPDLRLDRAKIVDDDPGQWLATCDGTTGSFHRAWRLRHYGARIVTKIVIGQMIDGLLYQPSISMQIEPSGRATIFVTQHPDSLFDLSIDRLFRVTADLRKFSHANITWRGHIAPDLRRTG